MRSPAVSVKRTVWSATKACRSQRGFHTFLTDVLLHSSSESHLRTRLTQPAYAIMSHSAHRSPPGPITNSPILTHGRWASLLPKRNTACTVLNHSQLECSSECLEWRAKRMSFGNGCTLCARPLPTLLGGHSSHATGGTVNGHRPTEPTQERSSGREGRATDYSTTTGTYALTV